MNQATIEHSLRFLHNQHGGMGEGLENLGQKLPPVEGVEKPSGFEKEIH